MIINISDWQRKTGGDNNSGMENMIDAILCDPQSRERYGALRVLQRWVEKAGRPLQEAEPKLFEMIKTIKDREVDEAVHSRMEELIAGAITFKD